MFRVCVFLIVGFVLLLFFWLSVFGFGVFRFLVFGFSVPRFWTFGVWFLVSSNFARHDSIEVACQSKKPRT